MKTIVFLELKQLRYRISVLAIVFLFMTGICLLIGKMAISTLQDSPLKLPVAVVNLDQSLEMELLLNAVLEHELVEERFDILAVATKESDLENIEDVIATVTFPEGFLASVINGENLSPLLMINRGTPLETFLLENLTQSLGTLMVQTQSGVYTAIAEMAKYHSLDQALIMDINLVYIKALLGMESTFIENDLSYVQKWTIETYYIVSIMIFLMFLSVGLFYRDINLFSRLQWFQGVRAAGGNYWCFYLARLGILFGIYFILFAGCFWVIQIPFSIQTLVNIGICTFFFLMVSCVIFNLLNHMSIAIQGSIVFHGACLILAGGIIPSAFLPQIAADVGAVMPIALIRDGLLGERIIPMIIISIILFVFLYVQNEKTMKGTAVNEFV